MAKATAATRFLFRLTAAPFPEESGGERVFGHSKEDIYRRFSQEKKGFFEMANGGTIFLDEIGQAPPELQVKLLRIIQESQIIPVGYRRPKRSMCGLSPPLIEDAKPK